MKRIILSLLLILAAFAATAQATLSPRSLFQLSKANSARHAPAARTEMQAFIRVENEQAIDELRRNGCRISQRFNGFVTARFKTEHLPAVLRVRGVTNVALSQSVQLCNDSARNQTSVNAIHQSIDLPRAFTGKGVIVGVIDTGFDFNHINFRDSLGRSRILAAYLSEDSTGVSPIVNGDTLRGSHYTTPQQIAALTTDNTENGHGTHTAGTAAGSFTANGLHGVAPEAKLVLCGLKHLYDTDIANSIAYIFHIADQYDMPAVVNMSLATADGPHDGTSFLSQVIDQLSAPGRICVVSAHNTGCYAMHIQRNFAANPDTLHSTINRYATSFIGYPSLWSSPGHHHKFAITAIDISTKKELLCTPFYSDLDPDSLYTLKMDSLPQWSDLFTGEISFAQAVMEGDRTYSILLLNATPKNITSTRLGLKVVSDDKDPNFNVWIEGGLQFQSRISGQTAGTKAGTISDLACGENAISVGAYISRSVAPTPSGEVTFSRTSPLYGMSYFSAWGPDARGIARPDIVAPGMVVLSSNSRYDTVSPMTKGYFSFYQEHDGESYPYAVNQGTSMSAPMVTGTIALWLQAAPELTVNDIRDIFDHTATRDDFVNSGDSRQWGRGKINALAGINYVLNNFNLLDINRDGTVDIADLNIIITYILRPGSVGWNTDLNRDGHTDTADINLFINALLKIE